MLLLLAILLFSGVAHADDAAIARGEYLARLGDCTSCHTVEGGAPYAGGFPLHTPMGTIYGSNITPNPEYGIGGYSRDEFARALRQGIGKGGKHLYPAMPYPSFALLTDSDIDDLYAYFMHGVAPVHVQPPQTKLPFPFNQRWGMAFWNLAFLRQHVYQPVPQEDAEWNRGAYLVGGIAPCGACHTPRNLAYSEKAYSQSSPVFLSGATADQWFSANLRSDDASGLKRWSQDDIARFLKTGHAAGAASMGNMTQVVENSGQYISDADRQAIAHYLKSLGAAGGDTAFTPEKPRNQSGRELPGAGLYAQGCARCHGNDGGGQNPRIPALAGNPVVLSEKPDSLILIVLQGGKTAQTQGGVPVAHMPSFSAWTDEEIAQTITFIRQSWGNKAPDVSVRDVSALRH